MISALQWVPRGACAREPKRFIPSESEMQMMQEQAKEEMDAQDKEIPAAFQMDRYDDEDDVVGEDMEAQTDEEPDAMEDITDDMVDELPLDALDLDDQADLEIRPTDAVLCVANTEEEFSTLEIQIYDEEVGNVYVHHEIALPAFPLALAWTNCLDRPGSFVAVGTFKQGIELWDLDVLDAIEPVAVLGGETESHLRGVASNSTLRPDSHADAVLCLDWNRTHRNMLLSGSADHTIKLWDLPSQRCMATCTHHDNKVACLAWHPLETALFASGAHGGRILLVDAQRPDEIVAKWTLPANPETLCWNPFVPSMLLVGLESGMLFGIDVVLNKIIFQLQAHAGGVTGVACSPQLPHFIATAGEDKRVTIWDFESGSPVVLTHKEMAVGALYSLSFCPDDAYTLAVGGADGILALWDCRENAELEQHFAARTSFVPDWSSERIVQTHRQKQKPKKKKKKKSA